MSSSDLDQIQERDLHQLIQNDTPESLTLEFKRELDLGTRDQKREAAKDVSALANTAGGRILYGIEERTDSDGTKVAGSLRPLIDGSLQDRLRDILLGSIVPRPRFRSRQVAIAGGGFVLAVEVYPSYGGDLHMVTAFDEGRFYKRGDSATSRMSEPEIREAYLRIAVGRAALEVSLERQTEEALQKRPHQRECWVMVPWYARPNLIDPRLLPDLRMWMNHGPFQALDLVLGLT